MNNLNNTCVLYFTTRLESEKFFSKNRKKQNAVQKFLFEKTLKEIQQSGLAYVISDGKTYGETFGNRINGAVTTIYQLGYQNVIIIGDDTPNLSAVNLLASKNNFENNILTIGPSADGGSYLISLDKESYQNGALENLDWQSNVFNNQLIENLQKLNKTYQLLPKFVDLNSQISINNFLAQTSNSSFYKILASIFSEIESCITEELISEEHPILNSADRGPPQFVIS
ncbi:DUF2064 domain-containing protein [Pedobacter alpinus]|uniref:DUF2064 domain-containing protein n=1 Tax=Pedobacter alpinus TaxID=1590643 RepID=A0ABW5TUW3_9SPHI